MDKRVLKAVLTAQENEITEHAIYTTLAGHTGDPHNRTVLKTIAEDEMQHYRVWKEITGRDVNPIRWRVGWYVLISRVFGLSFGLKLMERGEAAAQIVYTKLEEEFAELGPLVMDEQKHEQAILSMLEEERLEYAGAIVLGLNDALVELTGALAGLTLALQNGRMIAVIGLITGIAAAMSMGILGLPLLPGRERGKRGPGKKSRQIGAVHGSDVSSHSRFPHTALHGDPACLHRPGRHDRDRHTHNRRVYLLHQHREEPRFLESFQRDGWVVTRCGQHKLRDGLGSQDFLRCRSLIIRKESAASSA